MNVEGLADGLILPAVLHISKCMSLVFYLAF